MFELADTVSPRLHQTQKGDAETQMQPGVDFSFHSQNTKNHFSSAGKKKKNRQGDINEHTPERLWQVRDVPEMRRWWSSSPGWNEQTIWPPEEKH